jgi:xanthine/uracil permease
LQEEKARVVQTLLFVAGINTLLQSFLGTRLPAVIGGSYTFVAPTISIVLAARYAGIADPHERFLRTMRGTQGALIVASTLQIIMGFSGLWRIVVRSVSDGLHCLLFLLLTLQGRVQVPTVVDPISVVSS